MKNIKTIIELINNHLLIPFHEWDSCNYGKIWWYRNYRKHKQLLLYLQYSIVSGNPLLNEENLSEKQIK